MLDTSVAIIMRDVSDPEVLRPLDGRELLLSAVSLVELEGGVHRDPGQAELRRHRLEAVLEAVTVLPFGTVEARHYAQIIAQLGYSRPRVIDRMIAAHALASGVGLITSNPADFQQVPGLDVHTWAPMST